MAADGPEAIEEATTLQPFDLLLTDLMMPQMTGDELARRLRVGHPSLKVLYLTGFSDRLFKEKVTLWADEAFLDKPCSVKGLLQAVSLLLFGAWMRRRTSFVAATATASMSKTTLSNGSPAEIAHDFDGSSPRSSATRTPDRPSVAR